VTILCAALGNEDKATREAAAIGIAAIGPGDIAVAPILLQALTDEAHSVALECSSALSRMGSEIVPMLLHAFNTASEHVRRYVVLSIGNLGVSSELICRTLMDGLIDIKQVEGNSSTRAEVANTIGKLAKLGADCDCALNSLVNAIIDPDSNVRDRVSWALGQYGRRARGIADRALLGVLNDSNEDVRATACRSLGLIGAKVEEAVPRLVRVLKNDSKEIVRAHAAKALGSLGPDAATLALQPLVEALADPSHHVRITSCEALGSFGKQASGAVEPLKKLSVAGKGEVAQAASNALRKVQCVVD
jgi:HEAT repeat protein